jgi:hypothetical protein
VWQERSLDEVVWFGCEVWSEVRREMESFLGSYGIDDEDDKEEPSLPRLPCVVKLLSLVTTLETFSGEAADSCLVLEGC